MLKAQQQTISELRAELKQAKQERIAASPSQRRQPGMADGQKGRDAAREAMAADLPTQAIYKAPPALTPADRGAYVGLFGGGAFGGDSNVNQLGTVFLYEFQGGPLPVNATGRTNSSSVGFGGAQIGHEWSYGSYLLPALEIEGLFLARGQQRATLENPTNRALERAFENTFPTRTTVALANAVVGFRTPYQGVTPYLGVGMGAAYVSIDGASSTQIQPLESGINHFNSNANSSAWTFAAQAKAGVRLALGNSGAFLFGEYRYLYVGSVDQIFGNTVNSAHVPTSPWTVTFDDTSYHLATGGIGFSF